MPKRIPGVQGPDRDLIDATRRLGHALADEVAADVLESPTADREVPLSQRYAETYARAVRRVSQEFANRGLRDEELEVLVAQPTIRLPSVAAISDRLRKLALTFEEQLREAQHGGRKKNDTSEHTPRQ
jgi:hypothetical protein